MDSVISSALEEICSCGATGIELLKLWENLLPSITAAGLDLSIGVKQAFWSNLVNVRGLQFRHRDHDDGESNCCSASSIQSVDVAEKLSVMIFANENLRDCFVGLYDLKAREGFKWVSAHETRILELLARARSNGITQSELAKEFGMDGKEIFYHVRRLECQGLIVRQETVVRRIGVSNETGLENSLAVTTRKLFLHRYAKHLGSHQRLEITKKDEPLESHGDTLREPIKEDVYVKDFIPELKAICDKLDEAEGKVIVVRDIKQDLGYTGTTGHRAWRKIYQMLKEAHVAEEIKAKVDNKVLPCLRLLKKFSPSLFETKTSLPAVNDVERGQVTEQVVELSIDHQIYDLIDAAGSKGLTIIEVCKMLGINSKRYNDRLLRMFSRFGMDLRQEVHNKVTVYRVRTPRNVDPFTATASTSENAKNENRTCYQHIVDPEFQEGWDLTGTKLCLSTPQEDTYSCRETTNKQTEVNYSHRSDGDGKYNSMSLCVSNPPELVHTSSCTGVDIALDLVTAPAEVNVSPYGTSHNASSKPDFIPRYPCPTMTELGALRAERILNKLQEEKFMSRAELQNWLESFETDTSTRMDRKTLTGILNKLQEQGQCKCISVSVPTVTHCGSSLTKVVVLHPSFKNITPALSSQIQDKLRVLDMQSRGYRLSQLKDDLSVPELKVIQKNHTSVVSDSQAVISEAMRTNGFVLAKMVRVKLFHTFLWNYLSSLPGWEGNLSSGLPGYDMNNPHSTCILFEIDVAIKAIPLELFLQVVGSTSKFVDLIEKCRMGLRLSDLPVIEYKSLMDTNATRRLSRLINILRQLKLIRLVSKENSEGEEKTRHTTYKDAMELKPYIEEPKTVLSSSSGSSSLDLRPQIRHDFFLLEREAVDDYWRTLEYCYSAADPAAASLAFPGSAVSEVFRQKSWGSLRVMTANQRAELLKRLEEYRNKKLSLKQCEKIANDLTLTLEQVLRYYYDMRNQRLNRFQGGVNIEGNMSGSLKRKRNSSSRKRKRAPEGSSINATDVSVEKFFKQKLSDLGSQHRCLLTSSQDQGIQDEASLNQNDLELEDMEDPGPSKEEDYSSFHRYFNPSRLSRTRQKKILWTEKADRQLIIEYVRHRARLGANHHRAHWVSLPNLPAPLDSCKRRMASLKRNTRFRKSLMNLCNILGDRYANHLGNTKNSDCYDGQDSDYVEQWDDFDDDCIAKALEEVIQYKSMIKLQSSREERLGHEYLSEVNLEAEVHDPRESELVVEEVQNRSPSHSKGYGKRPRSHHLPQKFLKHLTDERTASKRVYDSLAVSNAVELLKLVFLNNSTAKEVPNLLAETLRRYSGHDLFAAYSYLRERKIMIGGCSGSAHSLSQRFVHNIRSSPFQPDTGKRAAEFSRWLEINKAALEEDGIILTEDLQCGDILHLFALISLGELSISPCLPDEGVGDTDDTKGLKHTADNAESCTDDESQKLKSSFFSEGEIISRREKGFPGLVILLSNGAPSRANSVKNPLEENFRKSALLSEDVDRNTSFSRIMCEDPKFTCHIPPAGVSNVSLWKAMASYAELVMGVSDQDQFTSIDPELFRTILLATKKAGDQGLRLEKVAELVEMQGTLEKVIPLLIIEVLQTFGQAVKVNAYNSVHVVNSEYSSKYFLTSLAWLNQEHHQTAVKKSNKKNGESHLTPSDCRPADRSWELSTESDNVHRVTILNLTEEVSEALNESRVNNELEGCAQQKDVSPGGNHKAKSWEPLFSVTRSCVPILPWINGDGATNNIVYEGLVRRVLGTVMQNPGILKDDIIRRIDTLNPQNCRELLKLMILDKHLIIRKMHQTTSAASPPSLLTSRLSKKLKTVKSIYREHFFANPLSTSFL